VLPNFLIIGVQKGATTWLANCLGQHPDVFMVEIKEIHFFHRHFEKGLKWYESHFNDWSGQTAVGEATPGYVYFPEVPGRIKATLGDEIKFIVSLRHPVDRAYSEFWMHLSRGRIPADTDFRTFFQQGDRFGMRGRGHYFAQLSRYLEYFPRENMLVLIYEEIKRDGQKAVGGCLEFLGVDSQFVPDALRTKANKAIDVSVFHHQVWGLRWVIESLPQGIERPLVSVGRRVFERLPKRKSYEPLAKDLRQELLSDFMPDIRRLEHLLDRDLSIWYAPSRA